MKSLRRFFARLSASMLGRRDEDRLRSEVEEHIAFLASDYMRAGMSPEEAHRQAVLKFGAVESIKEDFREQAGLPLLDNLRRDVKFALRQLRKNPGFACTAILVFAVGIAASVSIFAFVDAALLRPLPYPDPSRLVFVTESAAMIPRADLSWPDYLDWKARNDVFRSFDVYNGGNDVLTTPTGPEVVRGASVTAGFFRTLGVKAVLGRDFHEGENSLNAPRTVILSYSAWQKRFGGRKDVIGQTITLGEPEVIIGVLPKDFDFAPRGGTEFWSALHPKGSCIERRSCHSLEGIARLRDGVTLQAALAEMKGIAQQLEKEYPDSNRDQGAVVEPLPDIIVGDIRPILLMLLAGSVLLLVIACLNVSSLLLVRSESRKREMNVRAALGASPARLILQFVTEAVVLVGAAAALGLVLSQQAIRTLLKLIAPDMLMRMPFLSGLGMNAHVLLFAFAVSIVAITMFSIAPMLRLPLRDFRQGMAEGERGSTGRWRRFGGKMVVLEIATAMVLLVGAALLGQSFHRLLHVETGIDTSHLALLRVGAPAQRYKSDADQVQLERQIVSQVSALPGVQSVALATTPPLSFNGNTEWIRVAGRPYSGEHNEVNGRYVSSGFFRTLRARLLQGRFFTDNEDQSKPRVVVINQAFARKYFPGENPIGQQIGDTGLSPKSLMEIIGVVDDIREGALDSEIMPAEYVPLNQDPSTYYSVIVRTGRSEESVLPEMASVIRQIDPTIVAFDETTMEQRMHDSQTAYLHRSAAWLVAGFAALAWLLGVVGLYGVIAYSVSRRTREIGVRMALGAGRGMVTRMVLGEAGWLTAAGLVVGVVASLGAVALMRTLLFGLSARDLSTLAAVAVLLGLSALLASYLPARRAASVSPVEALRVE
ncbi:MAG: ADOP family duplicated permease [Terriglobales bacterium]